MPHGFERQSRVADHIKEELGKLLLSHSRDPRFSFVSISAIELAKDYSRAKVFVTVLDDKQVDEVIAALNKAAGFFRRELAHRVNLRTTPKLHFQYDASLQQGQKISELLAKHSTDESEKE